MQEQRSSAERSALHGHFGRGGSEQTPTRDLEALALSALDALAGHIAVLDYQGTIVAVNRAWRAFAFENGTAETAARVCEGANYLRTCSDASGTDSEDAAKVAAGVRAVLSGQQSEFAIEYPCHSACEERWFSARVTRFRADGRVYAVVAHENITARKQADMAVQRSEAKYRGLYHTSRDAVMVLGEGRFIDCNAAALEIFGCSTREQFCTMHPADLSPLTQPCGTDSLILSNRHIRDAIEQGSSEFEWVHQRIDTGDTFYADVLLSTMDMDGRRAVQAVVRDISERRRAEDELRESQAHLRTLIDTLPDLVWLKDVDGIYLSCNRRFVSFFGAPESQIVGKTDYDFTDKSTADAFRQNDIAAIAAGIPTTNEEEVVFAEDGHKELLETIKTPVRASDGRLIGVLGVARDITERKRTEEALRASEATLAESMRMARLGAWSYDVATQQFVFNDQIYSLMGTTAAREKGYTMTAERFAARFVDPNYRSRVGAGIRSAIESTDPAFQMREERIRMLGNGGARYVSVDYRAEKGADGRTVKINGVNQDISERMELLDALSHMASVVESSEDAIISFDLSGEIRTWNPGAVRVYGYAADEAVGRNISMLVQPEYPNLVPRILDKVRKSEPILRYEGMRIGKGGAPTDVSVNLSSVRDSEGGIVGGMEITRDVSRRNRAEQLLASSRDFYLKLLEDFPALIWRSDSAGKFDYLNKGWLEFTGSTLDEGLKSDWPGRIHPEDRKRVTRAYRSAFARRIPIRVEFRFQRADGAYRWMINQGRPYSNLDGTFAGFIGSCYDGTETRDAVEDHHRLMAAIEQTTDAIVITAADATIQYVNPAFERITGYSQHEAVGRNLGILRSGKHDDHFDSAIAETTLKGEVWSGQLLNQRKDGSCYSEFMTLSPVRNSAGETINLVAIKRDITEQVVIETQLRQAQRLESIGQLAAGIAHEINTPTQYVGDNTLFLKDAFSDLLIVLDRYAKLKTAAKLGSVTPEILDEVEQAIQAADVEYLSAEVPKAISQSLEGIERVAKIVRAMKEFSHPGTGEKTPTDINRAIETTLTVARNEWKYVAELELDLQPDLPLVPCLPGDLNQVILNIAVNAAHSIADVVGKDGAGGKGKISVQTRLANEWVEIRISDTGNGIPEHVRPRIFDPFFTTKGVGKGTGQGLAISHSVVVDKHGGTIRFESETGKGTTFVIRVPLCPPPKALATSAP